MARLPLSSAIALVVLPLSFAGAVSAPWVPELQVLPFGPVGEVRMENALWGETPADKHFGEVNPVVVAQLKGPGIITMIHFAFPAVMKLDRSVLLRIYWDSETTPSVDGPLVDFFCDPAGRMEVVAAGPINKKRGWNCYFPMPFRKSARVEMYSDDRRWGPKGRSDLAPCYSYVLWRKLNLLPRDTMYFHAQWRQQSVLLGKQEYAALEARGPGRFVGWNVTVRNVGPAGDDYPVDENEKFFIDGEPQPRLEFQGLEDSFGFSFGFPAEPNMFALTGWQPFFKGAAAYRFFIPDAIEFSKSLKVKIGFGVNEAPFFFEIYGDPQRPLQFSSVCYWYQKEPHLDFPIMLGAREREPGRDREQQAAWLKRAAEFRARRVAVSLRCGHPDGDEEFLEDGYGYEFQQGYGYAGFPQALRHCWADYEVLKFAVTCPKGVRGTLRMFILDGDNFMGGRRQIISVDGVDLGEFSDYQKGKWVEAPVDGQQTADGKLQVLMTNRKPGGNAVVSLVELVVVAAAGSGP